MNRNGAIFNGRKPTIFWAIFRALLLMLAIKTVLLTGAIFLSRIAPQLQTYAVDIFEKQVETRGNYIENFMLDAEKLSLLTTQVNETTEQLLEEGVISLEQLDQNSAESVPLFSALQENLILNLRSRSVTGIFMILYTQDLDACPEGTQLPGVYLRDLDPDAPDSARNEDLFFQIAANKLVQSAYISTATSWEPMLRYDRENCAFLYQPYQTARESGGELTSADCGYWTTEPFSLPGDDREIITYSQPLMLENGTVYGVIGVEFLTSYLRERMPRLELQNDESGSYLLAAAEETEEGTLLRGVICSTEDPALCGAEQLTYQEDKSGGTLLWKGTEYFVNALPLNIYSQNAPFSQDRWMLVGIVPENSLFGFSRSVQQLLQITIMLMILIDLLGSVFCSRRIARPVTRLSTEMLETRADGGVIAQLPPTGIREFDQFSTAFMQQGQEILDTSTKFLRIMSMASVEMAAYEIRMDSDSFYITDNFFSLLGLPEPDRSTLTKRRLEEIIQETLRRSEDEKSGGERPLKPVPKNAHTIPVRLPDGNVRYVLMRVVLENDVQVGLLEDATESVLERRRIERERDYDVLTGLYNRGAFNVRSAALFRTPEKLKCAALVMMDMDNLKRMNDTFGHDWGDRYIQMTGQFIQENAGPKVLSARLSGDEFIALFYGYDDREVLRAEIDQFCGTVRNYHLDLPSGETKILKLSTGVAWYPEDSTRLPLLQKYADFAMYQAKRFRKGGICQFDLATYQQMESEDELHLEFTQMLDGDFAAYHFQPIFSAVDGSLVAYEALLRVDMPLLRNPATVIKLAYETNHLYEVERMTLFKATETFLQSEKTGKVEAGKKLFINSISNIYLSDAVIENYQTQFASVLDRLVIEITEDEELDHTALNHKRRQLKGAGQFALDDYGSGYSNLINLVELMPNYVKVDMSIIRNIDKEPDKQVVVRDLVRYAHKRNMQIVAEGIETEEELRCVIDLKVDLLQGYLLSRPAEAPAALPDGVRTVIETIQRERP